MRVARWVWVGRCGLLGVVLVIGVGGFGPLSERAWGQQPLTDPRLSITVGGEFTSRNVDEKGTAGEFSGTANSGRVLVTLAFKPIPQVTLYGVGGGADLQIDEFDGYSANMGGIYGGGLTVSTDTLRGTSLFLDGRYLRFVTDDTTYPFGVPSQETITWNEYRARIGIRDRHFAVSPYGGIQVSFVRGEDHVDNYGGSPTTFDLEEQDTVGIFGGITIPLDPRGRTWFFTEFDLFDEYAISGGLTFAL